MKRPASARMLAALLVLHAVSCGRSDLLADFTGAEFGGGVSGTGASSATGGTGATGGALGGGAVQSAGGVGAIGRGGAGGGAAGRPGVGATGGRGGSTLAGTGGVSAGGGGRGGSGGRADTGGGAGKPPLEHCGDGVLNRGEECDAGEGPYARPAIELRSNGIIIEFEPVLGTASAEDFYDYSDESSHTGNENVAGTKIYFYRDYDERAVSLILHHGIDFEATGFVQPNGEVSFTITDLPASSFVRISDDEGECAKDSKTSVAAHWQFGQSTDGCVVGGIPFPGTWHLFVNPSFLKGINSFTALSGDGYRTGLALAETVELIASDEPGGCRRDCTLPRCGDGRLDAGELCDDGDDTFADGCTKCMPDGFDTEPPPR